MENNKILISIGIPFFNSENYLALAIKSVLNQSYKNWELILMNDGSSDNSLQIAKNYAQKDRRISLFNDGTNLGLPTRLNQLSKLAQGKYYARMDADDIMHPNRLENQCAYLEKHQEIDLVGSELIAINGNNEIIGARKSKVKKHNKYTLNDLLSYGYCVHPTIMGKTSWFKANKYDEVLTRTEDLDLWIRSIEQSNFAKMQCIGLYYREESTLSLKKYIISTKQTLKLYKKNKVILGRYNVFKFSIKKITKLIIYLISNYTGLISFVVKKRSKPMKKEDIYQHEKVLNSILSIKTS
jgi:glycosyltransferase involved in cell wall biosynthesis